MSRGPASAPFPFPTPRSIAEPPRGRVAVFAPHPDDEIVGPGGAIAIHRALGGACVQVNANVDAPTVGATVVPMPSVPLHPGVPAPNDATPAAGGSWLRSTVKRANACEIEITSGRPSASTSATAKPLLSSFSNVVSGTPKPGLSAFARTS